MGWLGTEKLAPGYTNAKYLLLGMACTGDFLQGAMIASGVFQQSRVFAEYVPSTSVACARAGGLVFGWNALALMLKDLGNYSEGCTTPGSGAPPARL